MNIKFASTFVIQKLSLVVYDKIHPSANKGFKFSMLLFYLKTIAMKSMIAEAIHLTRTDSSALS